MIHKLQVAFVSMVVLGGCPRGAAHDESQIRAVFHKYATATTNADRAAVCKLSDTMLEFIAKDLLSIQGGLLKEIRKYQESGEAIPSDVILAVGPEVIALFERQTELLHRHGIRMDLLGTYDRSSDVPDVVRASFVAELRGKRQFYLDWEKAFDQFLLESKEAFGETSGSNPPDTFDGVALASASIDSLDITVSRAKATIVDREGNTGVMWFQVDEDGVWRVTTSPDLVDDP